MNSYPNFAKVADKKYKINTDYKVALKCEETARANISEEERGLAIIYLLFGDEGLKQSNDWEDLLKIAIKFLSCGKETRDSQIQQEDVDVDILQDWEYIKASFFFDYKIKIENEKMHWWEFQNLLNSLSEDCILSRVRFVRNYDISKIKDRKEKEKWIKLKNQVALKKEITKTPEQIEQDRIFEQQLKGGNIKHE